MGECVSPAVQRYVLLRSLPSQFDALAQSLKINEQISIDELCIHIKDYCESSRISDEMEHSRDTESAAYFKERRGNYERNGGYKQYRNGKKKCYCCGSTKHLASLCPKRKDSSDSSDSADDYCDFCESDTHSFSKCKKFKLLKEGAQNGNIFDGGGNNGGANVRREHDA